MPIDGSVHDAHTILLGVEEEDHFPPDFKEYIRKEQLNWSRFEADLPDFLSFAFLFLLFFFLWAQPQFSFTDNFADLIRNALQKLISKDELGWHLVQFWAPTKTSEGRTLLTTQFQPFVLGTTSYASDARNRLCEYRMGICREYNNSFYADAEECAEEQLGLPGRVFLHQFPESTPDVMCYSLKEYPQRDLALRCKIGSSWAGPVFDHSSNACVGVLEIVSPCFMFPVLRHKSFPGQMYDIFQGDDNDEPPLPELATTIVDDVEQKQREELRKMRDRELEEAIAKFRRTLKAIGPNLPDGGVKMRAGIKRYQDEIDHRRLRRLEKIQAKGGGVMLQLRQLDQASTSAIHSGTNVVSKDQNYILPSLEALQNGEVTMQLDSCDQLPMDPSKNAQNVVIAERNIVVVTSSEGGPREMQERQHKNTGVQIEVSLDDILKYSKKSRIDAAKKLQATKMSEGRTLLTTQFQPFALAATTYPKYTRRLCEYRMGMCREYFYADAECAEEQLGLPGRVSLHQLPESTPYVKHYTLKEYPQRDLALRWQILSSWAVPVFYHSSHTCVGVLETVSVCIKAEGWHDKSFLDQVYDIFQEFGLLCFDGYKHNELQKALFYVLTPSLYNLTPDFCFWKDSSAIVNLLYSYSSLLLKVSNILICKAFDATIFILDFPWLQESCYISVTALIHVPQKTFKFFMVITNSLLAYVEMRISYLQTMVGNFQPPYAGAKETVDYAMTELEILIGDENKASAFQEQKTVLKIVCEIRELPLAMTWVPCSTCDDLLRGQPEVVEFLQDKNCFGRLTTFVVVSKSSHLRKEGVAGMVLSPPNMLYCSDITQLSLAEYPLVPYARHGELRGWFTLCLQSSYTANDIYVLEFFLPTSEIYGDNSWTTLSLILGTMEDNFSTFKLASGKKLGDLLSVVVMDFQK
ncbi:hypothetical protein RHSIM_RhsimUnG0078000 [Rhododendron simsii]|uniref:NLP1-9 GAF domain-containing protein n=1 Tax=Rhododendron simsii TaxID=118357 RepID=A0A834L4P9_RHOSS|nr:hypothetical protein RHSIM_RhsimUnG0078000 [Rhododendron simsii]